jgi:dolichyl-phosphate beta-glucosyltransferase
LSRAGLDVAIVVPCFNESGRMPTEQFAAFAAKMPAIRFVLVNDCSTDQTAAILGDLAAQDPDRFSVLDLETNLGKANAVRAGVLRALDQGAAFVG